MPSDNGLPLGPRHVALSEGVVKIARFLPQSFLWVQDPETAMDNPRSATGFPGRLSHCGNRRFLPPYQLLLRSVVTRTHQRLGEGSAEGQKEMDSPD